MKLLDAITVTTGIGNVIHWYKFTYNYELFSLASLQEYGNGSVALPALQFTYINPGYHQDADNSQVCNPTCEWPGGGRAFLRQATNGYGGKVTYDYRLWCPLDGPRDNPTSADLDPASPGHLRELGWCRQRVWRMTLSGGMPSAAPDQVTEYTYFDGVNDKDPEYRDFIGFQVVTATVTGALPSHSVHHFRITGTNGGLYGAGNNPKREDQFHGLEDWTKQYQGLSNAPTDLMAVTLITYTAMTDGLPAGVKFVAKMREDRFNYDGQATPRRTASEYLYDSYGNIKREYRYGLVDPNTGADIGNDAMTMHWGYYPNTTTWIIGLRAWENVFAGIVPENDDLPSLTTQTINYYDNAASYTTPPVRGRLTRVDRGLRTLISTTRYQYDNYGNQAQASDPNGHTTTTVYLSDHIRVERVTNALNQSVVYGYGNPN